MKKLLLVLMIFILSLGLIACGDDYEEFDPEEIVSSNYYFSDMVTALQEYGFLVEIYNAEMIDQREAEILNDNNVTVEIRNLATALFSDGRQYINAQLLELGSTEQANNYADTVDEGDDGFVVTSQTTVFHGTLQVQGSGNGGESSANINADDIIFNIVSGEMDVSFTGGDYTFVPTTYGDRLVIASNNNGVASSTASLTARIRLEANEGLSFSHCVSSEGGYDKLKIFFNGEELNSFSGTTSWSTFSIPAVSSAGTYELRFEYTKDGGSNQGEDKAFIDDLRVIGSVGDIEEVTSGVIDADFTPVGDYTFVPSYHDGLPCIMPTNTGFSSTTATINVSVSLTEGEIFMLDYYVSSEGADPFRIRLDSNTIFEKSGTSQYSWETYSYTATRTGVHVFELTYSKDSGVNSGADTALVTNIRKSSAFNDALLNTNQSLNISFGSVDYPLIVDTYDGFDCVKTTNAYINTTISSLIVTAQLVQNQEFSIEYVISSESENDWFGFFVNGEEIERHSGTAITGWSTVNYTATADGEYTFELRYTKDSSQNLGSDTLYLKNLQISSAEGDTSSNVISDIMVGGNLNGTATVRPNHHGFELVTEGEETYLQSTNAGYHNSSAVVDVDLFLEAGTGLIFDYKISSELGADILEVYVNEVSVATISGNLTSRWNTKYIFEASNTGNYKITFRYVKNSSVNTGDDVVIIKNVRPGSISDQVGNQIISNGQVATNDINFYEGTTGYTFIESSSDGVSFIQSNNNGASGSTSEIYTDLYMREGDEFTFEFFVSSESNYDKLRFYANGSEIFVRSGIMSSFESYTYVASSTGEYTFKFTYSKDGSVNSGEDCARVKNVSVTRNLGDVANILEIGSLGLTVVEGFDFTIAEYNDLDCIMSSNAGQASSTSTISFDAVLNAGDTLFIKYIISSEANDVFTVSVDGVVVSSLSGTDNENWTELSVITAATSATYRITLTYTKNSSINEGNDVVLIDSIYKSRITTSVDTSDFGTAVTVGDAEVVYSTPASSEYSFTMTDLGGSLCVMSTNTGIANSTAQLSVYVTLQANQQLTFDYLVSSDGYDYLIVYVDGESFNTYYGSSTAYWRTVTVASATEEKTVELRFEYHKDGSGNSGLDAAFIDNVTVKDVSHLSGDMEFSTGGNTYTFVADNYLDYPCVSANNTGYHSTIAYYYMNVYLNEGEILQFYYAVSSESANYDYLVIYANGSEIGRWGGTSNTSWNLYEYTALFTGEHSFEFRYRKDGSAHNGTDKAYLRDFVIVGREEYEPTEFEDYVHGFVDQYDLNTINRYSSSAIEVIEAGIAERTGIDVELVNCSFASAYATSYSYEAYFFEFENQADMEAVIAALDANTGANVSASGEGTFGVIYVTYSYN